MNNSNASWTPTPDLNIASAQVPPLPSPPFPPTLSLWLCMLGRAPPVNTHYPAFIRYQDPSQGTWQVRGVPGTQMDDRATDQQTRGWLFQKPRLIDSNSKSTPCPRLSRPVSVRPPIRKAWVKLDSLIAVCASESGPISNVRLDQMCWLEKKI